MCRFYAEEYDFSTLPKELENPYARKKQAVGA